jgi:uncharacterized cupin superfamily protein
MSMKTRISHLADVPVFTGLPAAIANPLEPERFVGRHEQRLGRDVGLTQFGVNLVTLEPGAASALRHWHEAEDEFVLVLTGEVTLVDDAGEHTLNASTFAGFPAHVPNAHRFVNRSDSPATLLVVGSRRPGEDVVHYPDHPLGPVRR